MISAPRTPVKVRRSDLPEVETNVVPTKGEDENSEIVLVRVRDSTGRVITLSVRRLVAVDTVVVLAEFTALV